MKSAPQLRSRAANRFARFGGGCQAGASLARRLSARLYDFSQGRALPTSGFHSW